MRAILASILALQLAACVLFGVRGEEEDRPGVYDATALAWKLYGRTDAPPEVRWVTGSGLNCTQDNGDPGFKTPIGCRGGYTLSPWVVSVAYLGPERPPSTTALAHELLHAAQGRELVADPHHRTEVWRPLAECQGCGGRCGLLDRAHQALAAAGL